MAQREIADLTAAEISAAVRSGLLAPLEVVEASLQAIEDARGLNAVITATGERALKRARCSCSGPLAGVPLLVKDLFDLAGERTTYGSSIYASHVPQRTASVVERLERAGAIVVGKANLHEFAWGATSQNPHWGTVQNPVHPESVAGGSSGGNAAALAAGLCALALGTDTGGSVRIPAACCDVVGFKPKHGVLPIDGCFPLAPTLDTVGPMARTVGDCALAYSAASGRAVQAVPLSRLTVGVLRAPPPVAPGQAGRSFGSAPVKAIADVLESLGARVVEAALPPPEAPLVPLFLAEATRSHAATFPSRRADYGLDLQHKLTEAQIVAPEAVDAARDALARWRKVCWQTTDVDVFLSPTLAGPVPTLDVWEPDVRSVLLPYTRPFSFLGWPAMAVGLAQFAGRTDEAVFSAAAAWEAEQPRPTKTPCA